MWCKHDPPADAWRTPMWLPRCGLGVAGCKYLLKILDVFLVDFELPGNSKFCTVGSFGGVAFERERVDRSASHDWFDSSCLRYRELFFCSVAMPGSLVGQGRSCSKK